VSASEASSSEGAPDQKPKKNPQDSRHPPKARGRKTKKILMRMMNLWTQTILQFRVGKTMTMMKKMTFSMIFPMI
jgi:hypothetical protein